ncbi:MAG: ATP-binding protein [Candidatus Marithrix sp.]
MKKALQESEEKYRSLVNNINIGVFRISTDGIFLNINNALAKMYGFDSVEQFMQEPIISKYIEPNDQLLTTLHEQGEVKNFELETIHKNGSTFHISISGILKHDNDNKPIFIDGVVEDITERKQMEIALDKERASLALRVEERTVDLRQANEELARASRLNDEFLANMSHEFRTPLNAVIVFSELLLDEIYGELNIKQRESIEHIEQAGKHLLSLITDILDLSKIKAGQMKLHIEQVKIDSICQESLQLVKPAAAKKQIKLQTAYDGFVTIVQADKRGLKQILVNLLTNAVKFTPQGGQIKLEIIGDESNGIVKFNVIDTGIGISEAEIEYLFQPFVQLDGGLSRQQEGTGLGLSLVYKLTELHGGGVQVESEVGKGSCFSITLPWQKINNIVANLSDIPNTNKLILVAEDNESNIIGIQTSLQAKGYQVVIAHNGIEAIKLTREKRPNLIIMDIQMPEMDGIEAIKHIQADSNLADIPIIALTTLAMPRDRERCLEAGANEYFSKPVNIKKLLIAIKTQLV